MSSQDKIDSLTEKQDFEKFSVHPKDCTSETLMNAHRFVSKTISGVHDDPTRPTLIKIFMKFAAFGVKEYVFGRMRKAILLELALTLIQNLINGGPGWARCVELQFVKTSSGGKEVSIAPKEIEDGEIEENFEEAPVDAGFLKEIDEAIFNFHDNSGKSPDLLVRSGQGCTPPYILPEADGSFITPTKDKRIVRKNRRSREPSKVTKIM